jgi:hypothetical protein
MSWELRGSIPRFFKYKMYEYYDRLLNSLILISDVGETPRVLNFVLPTSPVLTSGPVPTYGDLSVGIGVPHLVDVALLVAGDF